MYLISNIFKVPQVQFAVFVEYCRFLVRVNRVISLFYDHVIEEIANRQNGGEIGKQS